MPKFQYNPNGHEYHCKWLGGPCEDRTPQNCKHCPFKKSQR